MSTPSTRNCSSDADKRCLGIVFGVLCNLDLAIWDGPFVVQDFGAVELHLGETLVIDGLQILTKGAGYVRALHVHQQLTFFDVVADAGMDFDHATGGDRDDGNCARDVGIDRAGDLNGRSRRVSWSPRPA